MTEHDALGGADTLRRGLEHNEWHRTHRALVEQWDADLFSEAFATE
ncbi:hypothetical protein [Saccharopolyspora sp. ASAGF58]|nr:hypothetical protein [Saccharopolyspora sp. ASAGF58]